MANPTARVQRFKTDFNNPTHRRSLTNSSSIYYPGEMIGINASGYGAKCDDTAAFKFDGIFAESLQITDVAGGDGTTTVLLERPRFFSAKIAAAVITDVGRPVFAKFSDEVSYNPGTNHNYIGNVAEYISATEVLIDPGTYKGPELVCVTMPYNVPAVDASFFVADRAYKVIDIRGRVLVAGTGGACTFQVRKVASGTALASGTVLHTSTYNLVGVVDTNQVLTLSSTDTDLDIPAGTAIGCDLTGTATSAIGTVQVTLIPVGP